MNLPVSKENFFKLSDAYDKHSQELMLEKGEEYSLDGDFLAMENKLAGLMTENPAYASMVLASKHIAAMFVILEKLDPNEIKLAKWDERIRDGINLLKIASAFVHASQDDFTLSL